MDYSKKIKIGGGKIRVGGAKINHFSDWDEYSDDITLRHLSKSKHRIGRRILNKYFISDPSWSQYSIDAKPYSSSATESGYQLSSDGEVVSLSMDDSIPQRYIEGSYKLTWTDENGGSHTTRAIPNFSHGDHVVDVINEDLFQNSTAVASVYGSSAGSFYKADIKITSYPAALAGDSDLVQMPKSDRVLTDKYDLRYQIFSSSNQTVYISIAATEELSSNYFDSNDNPTGNGDPSPRNITITLQMDGLVDGMKYFYEIWRDSLNTVMGGENWTEEKIDSGDFKANATSNTITFSQPTTKDSITYFRAKVFKKTLGVTFNLTGNPTNLDEDTTIAEPATPFPKGMINSILPNANMVDLSFDGNYDNVYAMFGAPAEFDASSIPVELKSLTIKNCNSLTSFKSESPSYLSNVKTLDLSNNGLTSFNASGLSSVTSINLSNNSLVSFVGSGGDPISDSAFPICDKIETINLSNNSISDDGLKSLLPGIWGSARNGTVDFSANSTSVSSLPYYSTFQSVLTDLGWTIIL